MEVLMVPGAVARGGAYEPLFELATGGMATVMVARQVGAASFERLVVIKRVHPHLCREGEFVTMFVDEAQIASSIHHPNVVSVIDVAHRDAELLLVLDYVEGLSLAELAKAASEASVRIPPAVASRILSDVLSGVEAAHAATDLAGRPLHVVHRDVSPQNVLVGTDGSSRVIDFGIAKAATRLTATTSGVVKGKLSYMAPEQIKQQPLDRRADVFSAGVVLHELLTGARLFKAGHDGDAVLMVLLGEIPNPSSVAPDVPPEVDPVVLKALERNPADRFASAAELRDALEAACPPAPARDVGAWVERLGKEKLQARRRALEAALRAPPRVDQSAVLDPRPRSRSFVVPLTGAAALVAVAAYFVAPFAHRAGAPTLAAASTVGVDPTATPAPNASNAPPVSSLAVPEAAPPVSTPSASATQARSSTIGPVRRPTSGTGTSGLKKNPYGGP
jgi:serine/threonine-protein kinase